nr:hypothetical protein [Tanacetum cinerariifolium]
MMGIHALLTNFVEKFLRMVRFGNTGFAMIAGYRDVVISSMTIKKVYYVEVPLGYHNPKYVVPLMYWKIRLTASR